MQPAIIENLIEKFENELDEENFDEAKSALNSLEKL